MLQIEEIIYNQLIVHSQEDAPIEACGYLAGTDNKITHYYKLTNIDNSPVHFSFDAKEQFTVMKNARNKGLKILANYHSHPESEARPSQEDIRLAYDPNILYFIVSLIDKNIKAFKIIDNVAEEVNIEIV